MKVKPLKIKIKSSTPSAADRLYAQQQKNRKAAGLPDPSEYKKKLDAMKSEEVEQLDELSPQTKASYVAKAKEQIKQSEPFTKKGEEYRDIAKNFIAKRKKGITKANESVTLGRVGGRGNIHMYDRNPGPKDGSELENVPFHAKTDKQKKLQNALNDLGNKMKEIHPKLREAKDNREYGYEGDMAISQLKTISRHAEHLMGMMKPDTDLPEWVQSKITLATDYLQTAHDYLASEMNEEVQLDEKKKLPGLWANIHAKRKRGEPPAKPGDKDYPKTLNIESVEDDPKADQMTTDDQKFPKKMSRKASIVRAAAKKMPAEDQFQSKPKFSLKEEKSISFDELEDMRQAELESMSRKAQIVKSMAKGKEEKFQANPVLDSDVNPQTNKQ